MIGWQLPAGLAAALALATALLLLERSNHATTQVRADELGRRVIALQATVDGMAGVNQRLTAERNAYQSAQQALAAALEEAEQQRRAREAQVRQAAAEATARDKERRARPDVPPAEEMSDALADAVRAL